MLPTHAVGIDLGTTYSCISYLNEHGEPVTLANKAGELATPSVVLFDGDEPIVGTEALRSAILFPDRVVMHAKRFMGDTEKRWTIGGRPYTAIDISSLILKHLLASAREQIGDVDQAVITVPAQFSEAQRLATIEAGHRAGLNRVDLINEPVAAALCHVLGNEGLWFTELAEEQRILVFDLGGGTLDLSLVKYSRDEVAVIASDGDLRLGGIDWNESLLTAISEQFLKEFRLDPRQDPESLQFLSNEVEQAKRSLSSRPKAALTCQHAGHRKTYQVELSQFEKLTRHLTDRTEEITKRLLRDQKIGWARVDVVLTTGGASRMPMIRDRLKQLSGRTLNTSLSPDLSIAHGATYYAGMLLSNNKFTKSILNAAASQRLARVKQRSVNARGLGILVRDPRTNTRVPHYIIPPNTPLPAEVTQKFGTVMEGQKRVRLVVIESGAGTKESFVKLGDCVVDGLPPNLPEGSEIAVSIRYDEQAKVHVSAKDVTSGRRAEAEIVRAENLKPQLTTDQKADADARLVGDATPSGPEIQSVTPTEPQAPQPASHRQRKPPTPTVASPHVVGRAATPVPTVKTAKPAQESIDPGEDEFWRSLH
ncbi:MAG: Hsp70 family protein [Planctomycetota bacterium]|nr:Hsp70 family protein [Planctomycetota bacterium]